jgi:hypothetical protein
VVFRLAGRWLGLFVSLYLPWRTATCQAQEYFGAPVSCDLLNLFSSRSSYDGIETSVGHVAGLFALLLIFVAAASLVRPGLARRLPLGCAALAASYFSLVVGLESRSDTRNRNFDSMYAYGAYVGLAAGLVVLFAAAVARRDALARLRSGSAPQLASSLLAALVLVAYLLPWWKEAPVGGEGAPPPATLIGISASAAVVGAALAIWLAAGWSAALPAERVGLAASVALFTVGAAARFQLLAHRLFGLWFAVALAAILLVIGLWSTRRQLSEIAWLPWRELGVATAVALFAGDLFLPWQRWCYEADSELGPLAGRCLTINAWTTTVAAPAAVFALALMWVVLEPGRTRVARFEVAATFALLVVALGIALKDERGPGFTVGRGVGAWVGFGSATALLVLALGRSRPATPDPARVPLRLLPVAACVGYLVLVTLPWWNLVTPLSEAFFADFSWTTIIGVFLAARLLRLWTEQAAAASPTVELALLPVALLGLAAIDLFAQREAIRWGGGAVIGLCLLLAILGRVEQRQGFENFHMPNALRLDRL